MKLALFLSAALLAATAMAQDLVALLPDFPCHWNQAQPYNQVVQDEYGLNKPVGCVAVAGASILEYFKWPRESFGPASIIMDVTREIRTEPLDWARLAPTPLDARGRRTAQTVLYNLGLLTQMNYWGNGLSSTTPLSNLQKAFRSDSVGMASAYYVALGEGATEEDFETAIWASLRCGSPVAMSVGKNSAHAVVACGYRQKADEPGYETYIFSGYGSGLALQTLPNVAGYTFIEAVVTGIVAERPEGVTSSYALPVLGTVVDENNNPVHFAKVTLSIGGKVVAETFSDAKGRYGLWGWFGHDMTLSCEGQEIKRTATTAPVDVRDGVPYMDVNDLRSAIVANTSNFRLPVAERPTIYTDLEEAKTAANNNSKGILCLNSEDPNLKIAFREVEKYTLLYADPRLPAPFPEVDSLPDVIAFILDATGEMTNYTVDKSVSALNTFIAHPQKPTPNKINTETALILATENGSDYDITISTGVTVDEDVRLGTLSFGRSVTFFGKGSITWTNLEQRDGASLTLDGPNFRYVVPKKEGTDSYLSKSVTVKNGASLYFGAGDVSGYGYTETSGNPITIGPGGILTVVSRDTLTRRLILDGGHIDLGSRDTSGDYGFGTLDLLHTIVEVKGKSSVSALSGIGNAALCIRGNSDENNVVTKFRFSNGARLDCPVLVAKPKLPKDQGTLLLSGDGVAAFGTVEAPTMASDGVLLEGGTFTGGLTLENGARLTTEAPITVTGTLTVSGTVSIEEPRSGVFLHGNANTTVATSAFTAPNGFTVKKVGNDYRLVASSATDPVWYANGVREEGKPEGVAPENSLLVLTTTDRKESGLWEGYAAFRSSPAGGNWNVCIAANGNITEGTAAEYIGSMDCDYVLIGASGAEIPALDGTIDRLDGHHIGRLPLRETVSMGTIVDLASAGNNVPQTYQTTSDFTCLQGYVEKLRRAGSYHAQGRVTLLGETFGTEQPVYENDTVYDPALGQWKYYDNKAGTTFYALCNRYGRLKQTNQSAFPSPLLYCDGAFRQDATTPGRGDLSSESAGASLLWVEGAESNTELSLIAVGGDNKKITADCFPALYTLTLSPIGTSGALSQEETASPNVGEMLVLNPQGGTLSAILPAGSYTPTIGTDGIPSGAEHTLCGAVADALIKDPSLTVGQALTLALEGNPNLSTTLTLLGDPTVRIAPFIIPTEWTGEAGDSLWETAGNWRSGQAPTASDTVTVTLADGDHASILLPEDASATTLNIVGPESGSATLLLTDTTTDTSTGAAIGDLSLSGNLVLSGNVTVEAAIPIAANTVTLGAGATLRTTAELDFTENDINNYWRVSGDGTLDIAHLRPKFTQLPKTLRLTATTADTIRFSTQGLSALPEGFTVDAGTAWETSYTFANNTLTVTLTEAAGQPMPNPILPEGEVDIQLSEETLQALRDAARDGGISGDFHVAAQSVDGATRPIAELDDALACFEGLEPTVENGKVVVAYDFGVTGLRIEGDTVFVTLSVRGKGQTLTFTEGNAYAIAPQSLDGTQPLAAPPTVTPSTPTDDGTVELRFSLPEGDATFLFRATVSRLTP